MSQLFSHRYLAANKHRYNSYILPGDAVLDIGYFYRKSYSTKNGQIIKCRSGCGGDAVVTDVVSGLANSRNPHSVNCDSRITQFQRFQMVNLLNDYTVDVLPAYANRFIPLSVDVAHSYRGKLF